MSKMITLCAAICLLAVPAATAQVQVYTSQAGFAAATDATQLAFPSSADTAFANKPFGAALLDYSCTDNNTGINLPWDSDTPTVNVTAPNATDWICFLGPGWNAGLANINPTPLSPTIVASGEDDYKIVTFATPQLAVGFELLTNSSASESVTITFADGTTQEVTDESLGTAPNGFYFVGFKSLKPITSISIDTTGGVNQNEGITAVYASSFFKVPIDIKPGSEPNSINLRSRGKVTVAILSTAEFDATTVDPATVTFAGAPVALKGQGSPMASAEDVNGDGLPDLVVHFNTENLNLSDSNTFAVLTGATYSGIPIEGSDSVRIVPPGK